MTALILVCKKKHILIVHLVDLENGRKPDIVSLNKYRGDIFSEYSAESFKEKILRYGEKLLFEMVKKSLKGYICGRNKYHSTAK